MGVAVVVVVFFVVVVKVVVVDELELALVVELIVEDSDVGVVDVEEEKTAEEEEDVVVSWVGVYVPVAIAVLELAVTWVCVSELEDCFTTVEVPSDEDVVEFKPGGGGGNRVLVPWKYEIPMTEAMRRTPTIPMTRMIFLCGDFPEPGGSALGVEDVVVAAASWRIGAPQNSQNLASLSSCGRAAPQFLQ